MIDTFWSQDMGRNLIGSSDIEEAAGHASNDRNFCYQPVIGALPNNMYRKVDTKADQLQMLYEGVGSPVYLPSERFICSKY